MTFADAPGFMAYICLLFAIFGACMGSFLNCFAWRVVHNESVLKGRSHCDICGHVLTFGDLIPIVSYIIHKGKCRYCGTKISPRHLICECVSALVYAGTFWWFGRIGLTSGTIPYLVEYILFFSLLMAAAFADMESYIIPDRFLIGAIVVRLLFIFIFCRDDLVHCLIFSAVGGFAVAGALLIVVLIFEKIIGREAMGGGDIKLIFVIGLFLGWKKNLLCLFCSCIIGIIFALLTRKKRDSQEDEKVFPFGPSIALAAFLVFLFGDKVIYWYMNLLNI